ncbi:hypothetical protein HHI36_013435 [Cryptolaemus montrouzieri]|uniref:Uncharacterized protein n=1 Tax=Cryptolaemus montrouzieri TaxID=559131 RepID=A0ABD2NI93_9CUCU
MDSFQHIWYEAANDTVGGGQCQCTQNARLGPPPSGTQKQKKPINGEHYISLLNQLEETKRPHLAKKKFLFYHINTHAYHHAITSILGSGQPTTGDEEKCRAEGNHEEGDQLELPTLQEVREAIKNLPNNESSGNDSLPSEVIKSGGEELIHSVHKLIEKIWKKRTAR